MDSLFLGGGGDEEQSKVLDKLFAKAFTIKSKLLYLPIAMDTVSHESAYEWIRKVFNPLGISDIVMWSHLENKQLSDLNEFTGVYIGGGNTFQLLNDFKRTGFDLLLKQFISNGGIIYGGSAGAIVLGKNIMTCSHMDENAVNLKQFEGLNMINDYSIWCHYETANDLLIFDYIKKYKNPVIAIPETSGVCIASSQVKVIGIEPIYVFKEENKRLMEPNEII